MMNGAAPAAPARRPCGAFRGRLLPALCFLVAAALPGPVAAAPIHNPDNGHDYEAITRSQGIIWDNANVEASARTYKGMHGHLATVTSPAENDFILQNLPPA